MNLKEFKNNLRIGDIITYEIIALTDHRGYEGTGRRMIWKRPLIEEDIAYFQSIELKEFERHKYRIFISPARLEEQKPFNKSIVLIQG